MRFPDSKMKESVTITPVVGTGGLGQSVYGTPRASKCYAEASSRMVMSNEGKQVVADVFALFSASETLAVGDKVTLWGSNYHIIKAEPCRPNGKTVHIEAYLRSIRE